MGHHDLRELLAWTQTWCEEQAARAPTRGKSLGAGQQWQRTHRHLVAAGEKGYGSPIVSVTHKVNSANKRFRAFGKNRKARPLVLITAQETKPGPGPSFRGKERKESKQHCPTKYGHSGQPGSTLPCDGEAPALGPTQKVFLVSKGPRQR